MRSTSWPTRFDWAIIGATRNEHLRRTIAELRPHTARLRNLSHVDPQRVEVSVAEHLVICDALLAGDADAAAAGIAEHLAESLRTIFRNLATGPGDGPRPARLKRTPCPPLAGSRRDPRGPERGLSARP